MESPETLEPKIQNLKNKLDEALKQQEETKRQQAHITFKIEENKSTIIQQSQIIRDQTATINSQKQQIDNLQKTSDYEARLELQLYKQKYALLLQRNNELEAENQTLKAQKADLEAQNKDLDTLVEEYKARITALETQLDAVQLSTKNRNKAELIQAIIRISRKDCETWLTRLLEDSDQNPKGYNAMSDYFQELLTIDTKSRKQLSLTFLHRFPELNPFSNDQKLVLDQISKRITPEKYLLILNCLNFIGPSNSSDEQLRARFFSGGQNISNPSKFAAEILENHPTFYFPLGPRAKNILAGIQAKVTAEDYFKIQRAVYSDEVGGDQTRKLFFDFVASDLSECRAAYRFVQASKYRFKSTWSSWFWK